MRATPPALLDGARVTMFASLAPGVAVGAINAPLCSEASNLRNLEGHLVRRRQGLR
ncbi:hypothetical protein JOD64_003452 [Micromonospora luteifusca]|uniref:Uncharacterized protein n=1 Tax=Micromonospora luteifusca TaxID=709860 RepID=A0ABS2LVL5_9ACTN|nr:hypothetical protein [Micromonospora luteifusca]MBM7492230.1 hypothetical protein [Micromonospora luteifusca]